MFARSAVTEQVWSASKLSSSCSSCSIRPAGWADDWTQAWRDISLIKNAAQPNRCGAAGRSVTPKTWEGVHGCNHPLWYCLEYGGEGGVNISGIGPHGPSLAEYQASKWLHMEERRVLGENTLTEDSAYSQEEITERGFEERGYNNRLSKPLYKTVWVLAWALQTSSLFSVKLQRGVNNAWLCNRRKTFQSL